jgi:hypothetical protein
MLTPGVPDARNLKEFVIAYLRRAGAVAEEVGFELVDVLVPDALAATLGASVLRLAFDYEVARENPDSIFLTYGSDLLDRIVRAARETGRFTQVYPPDAEVRLPARLERLLATEFDFVKCKAPALESWAVYEHTYYRFDFRTVFQSYDQVEEMISVLVDGITGRIRNDLLIHWARIPPAAERPYHWPRRCERPLAELHARACLALDRLAQERAAALEASSAGHRDRELAKMERYFAENMAALQRRLSKTDDPARQERLRQQLAAAEIDRRRRGKDIRERYAVTARAVLDGLVVYYQPKIELQLRVQQRDEVFPFLLHYNPLDGRIEPPLCPHCDQPFRRVLRDAAGTPCCPECR